MSSNNSEYRILDFFMIFFFLLFLVFSLTRGHFSIQKKSLYPLITEVPRSIPLESICGIKGGVITDLKYSIVLQFKKVRTYEKTNIKCLLLDTKNKELVYKSVALSYNGVHTYHSTTRTKTKENLSLYISSIIKYSLYKVCNTSDKSTTSEYPLQNYGNKNYHALENQKTKQIEVTCGNGQPKKVFSKKIFFRHLYQEYILATNLKQKILKSSTKR